MFCAIVAGKRVGDWGTMEMSVRRVGRWRVRISREERKRVCGGEG